MITTPILNARTIELLDRLRADRWFRRCGQADLEGVILLRSWSEALDHAASVSWENVRLEAANDFRSLLENREGQLLGQWNEKVVRLRPLVQALVNDQVIEGDGLPSIPVLRVEASWDILHLCMECEYSDHAEPGLYHALGAVYEAGHFPCGIEAGNQIGRLISY